MKTTPKLRRGKLLLEIIKDPERKPILRILKELIILTFIHKEFPGHYFTNYLFKDGATCVEDYLPIKFAARIVPRLNDQRLKEVLDNKLYFDLFYRQFNIEIPLVVMYNHGKNFCRGSEVFQINSVEEFNQRLKELFELYSSLTSIIVKKIYASSKGADIYKIRKEEVLSNHHSIRDIYLKIIQSEFIFQETIIQHAKLNALNPSSVNTIRIDTLLDDEGKVNVLSAYIRMSLRNHFVDNIGSGGCMVGVDLKTGELQKYARSDFNYDGAKLFTRHPMTGTVFEGFMLPYINEIKDLVTRAALLVPGLRIIGWDVAISEAGPVIIEGNSDYGIRGNDIAYGGYLAHPVLRKVLEEIHK
jgi:hypothetical protein